MKPLRLSPHHKPPKNPSRQYLRDMAWLKGLAASQAPGKVAIKAANEAEARHIADNEK